MAKLVVPPADRRLTEIFTAVIASKSLLDDELWTSECLPLLNSRLDQLHNLVREAQVANAHTPNTDVVDGIFDTIDRVKAHLHRQFSSGAPYTVQRLGELVVDYGSSGYLLTTVIQAQKYVLALARTIMVLSKETDYEASSPKRQDGGLGATANDTEHGQHAGESGESKENGESEENEELTKSEEIGETAETAETSNEKPNGNGTAAKRLREELVVASAHEYEEHDLPPNIRFVALPWAETSLSSNVQDFDVESSVSGVDSADGAQSPAQKKPKNDRDVSHEKTQFQLLSPLHMDGKLEDVEFLPGCFEERALDYKVDHSERFNEEVPFMT